MSDSEDDDLQCYSDDETGQVPSSRSNMSMTDLTKDLDKACLKTSRVITVDAGARIAALRDKKYTKPRTWPYLLPFLPDAEADQWINEVARNISACILIDDMSSALKEKLDVLIRYVGKYGLRFTKEQHLRLIKTIYGLVVRPKLNANVVHTAAAAFVALVRGSKFTHADLVLDWRPIFNQFERCVLNKEKFIGANEIQMVVTACTYFFEKGAEKDIWKRIRPYISPATMITMATFVGRLLPTRGFAKEDFELKKGDLIDDHFLPILWHFFVKEEINDYWTDAVIGFFVRLTKDSPSAALPFFHQHLELIFTRLIRTLGLTAREGKVYISIDSASRAYQYYGKWIGFMLGTHPSVETHLLRLLSVVESHVHPSRNGTTEMATLLVSNLLLQLTVVIMKRCRRDTINRQRKSSPAHLKDLQTPPLADSTITNYVKALLSILVPALHGGMSTVAGTLLGELAFLRPGLVIPKILDQLYPSISALCEPERLTNSLAALKRTLILIAADRVERGGYSEIRQPTKKDWLKERDNTSDLLRSADLRKSKRRKRKLQKEATGKKRSSTEGSKKAARSSDGGMRTDKTQSETDAVHSLRPHLVYIAEALIECLDINDIEKAAHAYEVFTLLFAVMPIVDCSTAENEQGAECTEEEHRLIQLSKKIKDIILKFVDKTFVIIDALATNAPSTTGLESVGTIKDAEAGRKQGSDECAMEGCIAHAFGTLFSHTDETMGKVLCEKVLSFARTSLLDNSTAAGIITNIIIDCVYEHPACVDDFLEYIINEMGEVVDEETQSAEHVDGMAAWLAALAPAFCFLQSADVHENLEDLLGMATRLLGCKNKVMYEAGCACINSLVLSLLGTAPMNVPSKERYKLGRTPAKLWGATIDVLRASTQWSHPVEADFVVVAQILEVSLFAEMRRLKKPETLSREQMRKSIMIVLSIFLNVLEFTPIPQCDRAPTHFMSDNGLPRQLLHPIQAYHQLAAGTITFEGGNVRVALIQIIEGIIVCEKCHDSQALESLVALIPTLEKVGVCQLMTHSAVLISMLHNPLLKERSMTAATARDKLISVYNTEPPPRDVGSSTFDCRVMRALFKLAFSLYETVRIAARIHLSRLLTNYCDTTLVDEFIDDITNALTDPRPEITKGALQLLVSLGLPGSKKVEVRARIWPLLLKCRRPEDAKLLKLLDDCYDQVKGRYHRNKPDPFPQEYLHFVENVLKSTPAEGEWKKVDDLNSLLTAAKDKVKERGVKIQAIYDTLSFDLHSALRAATAASPCEKTMETVMTKMSESALPSDFVSAKAAPSPPSPRTALHTQLITAPSLPSSANSSAANSPTTAMTALSINSPATSPRLNLAEVNKENTTPRRPSSATPSDKSPSDVPTVSTATVIDSNKPFTVEATSPSRMTSCKSGRPSDLSQALGQLMKDGAAPADVHMASPHSSPAKILPQSPGRPMIAPRQRQLCPPPHTPLLPNPDPHFHIRTHDLCVEMITLIENRYAKPETMKEIILPRLLEERIEQRNSAIDDLLYWLRKNKPPTARELWACPPKTQGKELVTYGLRPDNIALVYDSENLPNTEQKWTATRFFRKTKGHFAWPIDGKVSLPARTPIPLGIQMNAVDRHIVEWFSSRENVFQLFEMTLAHLGETGDEFDTDLLNVVYYLLRNYPDAAASQLLPPLRETLEKLLAGKHVHEGPRTKAAINLELASQRLAAELFLGIGKGTKYLPYPVLDELWKWMAPSVIAQFEHQNFQATAFWTTAFEKLLTKEDMRRFWWLVEGLINSFDAKKTIAPDERWKPANRLSMFILANWRYSEMLNRVLAMAFDQLIPIATSDTMRRSIAALIGDAAMVSNHRSEFFLGVPERFRVRSIDEYLMQIAQKAYKISRQASPLLLDKFDVTSDKTNRRDRQTVKKEKERAGSDEKMDTQIAALSILLPPESPFTPQSATARPATPLLMGSRPLTPTSGGRTSRGGRGRGAASKGEDVGQEKDSMYARMLIEAVFTFYESSSLAFTNGLFKVLPLLIELAVENEAEDAEIEREHDIRDDSSTLVHQYMACIPLNEGRTMRIVEMMEMIIKDSTLATQRASALKYLHVIVLSNIYLFDRLGRPVRQRLHALVTAALRDKEMPVRREAGNCLCAFLHIGYLELTAELEVHFHSLAFSPSSTDKQAGCLGFSAIVRAFPDQFTVKVVPSLRELCRLSSGAAKDVLVQHWATNALRDFRASHRDEWPTDAATIIGADLMFLIENELSPPYYV